MSGSQGEIELSRLLAHTWGPALVAAAAVRQHGPDASTPLYEAMARPIFAGADHYRVTRQDLESVMVDALFEVGLPARLAKAAASDDYDGSIRASHNAAMRRPRTRRAWRRAARFPDHGARGRVRARPCGSGSAAPGNRG